MSKSNPFQKTLATPEEVVEETTPEETPEEVVEEAPEETPEETPAEVIEEEKPAKVSKRRTVADVEAAAAEREAELQAKIDALQAAHEATPASAVALTIVEDEVVFEGASGGEVRKLAGSRTLMNNDWRATKDGLKLLVGRSDHQMTTQFQFPIALVPALSELLSQVAELDS